jgi:hypothetical protein
LPEILQPLFPLEYLPPPNAVEEFRYLLARGYPKSASLDLVGNRHDLNRHQRRILHRGVCSPLEAETRRARLVSFSDLSGASVAIDGYNVIITLESAVKERTLLLADDGVVRDIAGISSSYRAAEVTFRMMGCIAETLLEAKVAKVAALFLSSMSKSGELASEFGKILKAKGMEGESKIEKAVERILPRLAEIVMTANSAIMDQAQKVFDLAGFIITKKMNKNILRL